MSSAAVNDFVHEFDFVESGKTSYQNFNFHFSVRYNIVWNVILFKIILNRHFHMEVSKKDFNITASIFSLEIKLIMIRLFVSKITHVFTTNDRHWFGFFVFGMFWGALFNFRFRIIFIRTFDISWVTPTFFGVVSRALRLLFFTGN